MRKSKHISLFNRAPLLVTEGVILALCGAILAAVIWFWNEMPLAVRVLSPILVGLMLLVFVLSACYGMYIAPNGTVRLFFLFRVHVFRPEPRRQISLVFTPFAENRYYASVCVEDGNEEVFYYDYVWQLHDRVRKKLAVKIYTLSKEKAEAVAEQLSATAVKVTFSDSAENSTESDLNHK